MTDNYCLWDEGAELVPPRSKLISLKPIAHRTIWQELYEQGVKVTRKLIQKRLFPHRIFLCHPEIRNAVNEEKRALLLPLVETNRKQK